MVNSLINFFIGFLTTLVAVWASIWVFNRYLGDIGQVGKGSVTGSTGATKLFPVAAQGGA